MNPEYLLAASLTNPPAGEASESHRPLRMGAAPGTVLFLTFFSAVHTMNSDSNIGDRPPGPPPPPEGAQPPGQPNKEGGTFSQEYRHQPISARVPERVAKGVLSTGVLVLDGPTEFVLDFMQGLARPMQVAARVVLTPPVMEQLVAALRDNLSKYEQRFGPPPPLPKPPTDRRPTLQEIYDEFKLPDEQLSGTYANAVMIGHSPSEFFFDFITNFYPTSAVSSRVYLAAQQIPRMLEALTLAFQRFQQRVIAAQSAMMRQQQMYQQQFYPGPGGLQQPMPPPPGTQPPQQPPKPPETPEPPPQG